MSIINRITDRLPIRQIHKSIQCYSSQANPGNETDNFRALNLKTSKGQFTPRKKLKMPDVLPPRSKQMAVDQDWGSVWPGPRTFHPATVPLPIRQGFVDKGAPPHKYGNAELMKIPNFLHLTPPVIKQQCEALKKFCTPWPKNLDTEAKREKHFPLKITSSNYCHSSPTIRDPLSRIVTLKVKLSNLKLDSHSKDKFLRVIGEKYDEKTDVITIVTDRCPTKKQNYDYAMYLLTAVCHESWKTEPWEKLKTEADMEVYDWSRNVSKTNIEVLFGSSVDDIPNIDDYRIATEAVMNEGESEYTVNNYGNSVRQLLRLPTKLIT